MIPVVDLAIALMIVAAAAIIPTPPSRRGRLSRGWPESGLHAPRLNLADSSMGQSQEPVRQPGAASRDPNPGCIPEALDLCAVVLAAGGTIRDTIDALGSNGPDDIAGPCRLAAKRCDHGSTLDSALRHLQTELGPQFQPLTGTLLLAHNQGGSVAPLLNRLAIDANTGRRQRGQIRARRLPVALLLPLVLCSLPAVVVGVLIPMAIVSLRQITI